MLRVVPADASDLPAGRRTDGTANFDFDWAAPMFAGKCLMMVSLPAYDLERIHTGQVVEGKQMWTAEFAVGQGVS